MSGKRYLTTGPYVPPPPGVRYLCLGCGAKVAHAKGELCPDCRAEKAPAAQVWHAFVCPFDFCRVTYKVPAGQPTPTCDGGGRWHRPVPMVRRDADGAR